MKRTFGYLLSTAMLVTAAVPVSAHQKDKELEARVDRLERMADNPVLMQLSRRLGEQQKEIQNLNDRIDRMNYQLKQYQDRLDQRYQDTDDRLNQLEKTSQRSSSVGAITKPSTLGGASDQTPLTDQSHVKSSLNAQSSGQVSSGGMMATRPATQEEKQKYQAAFEKMKKTDFKEAAASFSEFRTKYPDSELAGNASYWSGEAYMVLGEKDNALNAFKDVFENYPMSPKAPSSMLRAADTLQELGQSEKAKSLLETLVKKYPDDRMAQKAQSRLKAL